MGSQMLCELASRRVCSPWFWFLVVARLVGKKSPSWDVQEPVLRMRLDNKFSIEIYWRGMRLQLLKKLSQCLAVLKRLTWHKSDKLHNNLKIVYVILCHLSF
jgi:hypothetical protein